MTDRNQYFVRLYTDPKNYPRGFRRSGDFSIKESDALEKYGFLFNALMSGVFQPALEQDKQWLEELMSNEAKTIEARAWLKYQARITRPKLGSIYASGPANDDDVSEIEDDSEDSEL